MVNIENNNAKRAVIGGAVFAASIIALIGAASAETFDAKKISFRDVTGAVEIVTTSGDEIDVEIRQGKKHQPLEVSEKDGVVVIIGEKWRADETRNCCDRRIRRDVNTRKDRKLTTGEPVDQDFFDDYPTIIVAMPVNGDVDFIDAWILLDMERLNGALLLDACYVYGQTGDVDEAIVGLIDGSRLVMGDINAGLEIDISGDADIMVGDTQMVDVDIAGPGDVIIGDINGMFDVSIAGSGIVRATRLDGPMTARIAGSGGVAVKGGRADRLRAHIDGSGGIYFGGVVTQPELRLFGSSEVRMKSVNGRITHHGGGVVYVGDEVFSDE
jgi:hypothetical protein